MESPIRVRNLSKIYKVYRNPWHRLRERLPWGREQLHREVRAVDDVTFDVPPGTCMGVIGGNGAGKSTLLKILTGTTTPSAGSYSIRGRVASLLELGAGFNRAFTGRENIFMNAALLGLSRAEAGQRYQEILDFSELRHFIDAPLRTYSSGMVCRLGFSVAVAVDPDVLIIDEILSVGDMHFRRKSRDKMMEYKRRGKSMFFCSHSLHDVRQICENTIWMRDGKIVMCDDSATVTNEYAEYENQLIDDAEALAGASPVSRNLDFEDHARILSADIVDPQTRELRHEFARLDDIAIRIHIRNGRRYEPLHLAVGFATQDGTLCLAMTTEFDGVVVEANEAIVTLLVPKIPLVAGHFAVPIWLLDSNGVHRFHEKPCRQNLIVSNRERGLGLFVAEREWEIDVLRPPRAQLSASRSTESD